LGRVVPAIRAKAEFAKIGRYYATESMLVWDDRTGQYDAELTPEFGSDTLASFYHDLASGASKVTLGEHAAF